MDAFFLPQWLDGLLIAPFRLVVSPQWGFWLGCAALSGYCVLVGELTSALLFLAGSGHYERQREETARTHELSMEALHSGNKEAYLAINRQAHDAFGKEFFAQGALGMAGLWPVPFALAWLSLRFEGIAVHSLPYWERDLGYPFVLLTCYILLRIAFARLKKHLPLFRRIHALRKEADRRRRERRRKNTEESAVRG